MRQTWTRVAAATAATAAILAVSWVGIDAQGRGRGAAAGPAKPSPRRDLSGVWMKGAAPAGVKQFDGSAWTPGVEPPLSVWGLAEKAKSKANNSGDF